jgi:DNA polymerase III subunit delta
MSAEKIIDDWKRKKFDPVYWLEGEEEYFIDKLVKYAEATILSESEASFNLTVFYGREASWTDIVNACMRYPMFSDRQVVIIKEAQHMRDIEKLESYVEKPLSSTVLIVAYKEKKVDGRTKFAKVLKDKANFLSTKKLYDNKLPEWTQGLIASKGYSISPKGLMLLVEHIGNDLSRIENEIDKMIVNLEGRTSINEQDIENFVGISKEYNAFELQNALVKKDLSKAIRIIQYFESNPKAAPIQLVLPSLYLLFSKAYMIAGHDIRDDKALAASIGVNSYYVQDYITTFKTYGISGIENCILLLHHYNLRSVGVNDSGTPDGALLKELVVKMIRGN